MSDTELNARDIINLWGHAKWQADRIAKLEAELVEAKAEIDRLRALLGEARDDVDRTLFSLRTYAGTPKYDAEIAMRNDRLVRIDAALRGEGGS